MEAIAKDLKRAEPPTKTGWNDQKRYVRKELKFHAGQIRGTAGKPSLHQKLSTSEQTIVAITGMKNNIEGSDGISSQGLEPPCTTESELVMETSVNGSPQQTTAKSIRNCRKKVPSSSKRKDTSMILKAEVKVQKELLKRIRRIEDNTRALNKNFTILNNSKGQELEEIKTNDRN
ncbi:unnamed protein product [Ceratitis capitata]|uniref:(Mediterranean fruit fly) hypothetical protein n=1 Tax=Ceratitis capitata TaxID=7213 RepID=A0A811URF5_CERCA|nr:unnamed protein product [Ceratitis capitata]